MDSSNEKSRLTSQAATSARIVFVTLSVCCFLYPLAILGLGQAFTPYSANGSLLRNGQGQIVGSELLAQRFERPEYFWPRPSAVDYNAAAAGGSNLSPTSAKLRERAKVLAAKFGATASNPVPADLVAASASGLDPHITLAAAKYQAGRVASARGLTLDAVMELLMQRAARPAGASAPQPLVNVLLLNLELDRLSK